MTDELPVTVRVFVPTMPERVLGLLEAPPTLRAGELPDSSDRMLSEQDLQDWKNWGG